MTGFGSTNLDDIICKYALQLVVEENGVAHPAGTCILVAPHIALTATHIINECDKVYGQPKVNETGDRHSDFIMLALQYGPGGDPPKYFVVEKLFEATHTDITVLIIRADRDVLPRSYPKINLIPPAMDDKITAFGYTATVSVDLTEVRKTVNVDAEGKTSVGVVKEVYAQRRDSSFLPWPCFSTNARFDDTMSGGPVFDQKGAICGLIATNLPPETDEEEHYSTVTLLWPLMSVEIDVPWEDRPELSTYTLHEFFGSKPESVNGIQNVVVENDTVKLLTADFGQ